WDRARPLAEEVASFDPEVILPSNGGTSRAAIEAGASLKLIQQPAVGVDGIDLAAAKARGIPVCNAPAVNTDAVAHATLLLILALARRTKRATERFDRAEIGGPLGIELGGRTLGLIGAGQTASRVGRLAEAFGMSVRTIRSSNGREDFHALLAASDVVSIH